ncbi:hypothetical protein C0Q70_16048 [Pomacea canaliculata]|uniref:Uncharacterized protein n=1 Tax=Pomacea canaliculata TaxID=400727 RepID=A0A2T7NNS2_POMCA|nr:hypothetical protein C0Q70_16048 [Pomacea canaliculata]
MQAARRPARQTGSADTLDFRSHHSDAFYSYPTPGTLLHPLTTTLPLPPPHPLLSLLYLVDVDRCTCINAVIVLEFKGQHTCPSPPHPPSLYIVYPCCQTRERKYE